MRYRPSSLKQNYLDYKSGDFDALNTIFASERLRLFDFLIRMTGQQTKSLDTVDEAILAVGPALDLEDSLQELLVLLYKTARNFTIENWNSDTSRLENSAYSQHGVPADRNTPILVSLEHVVRRLHPKQREVFLLHERFGFSPDEVAEIVGNSVGDVEELFAGALSAADAAMPGNAERIPEFMTLLKSFPIPDSEVVDTQNLSLVFKNLKKSSKSTSSGWVTFLGWLVFVGGVIYFAFSNGWIANLVAHITTQ